METTATVEMNVRTGVPIAINNVEGWTCEKCGKPADETKSLWYLRVNGRMRVWHPGCRR
jgi:hypothetical protein